MVRPAGIKFLGKRGGEETLIQNDQKKQRENSWGQKEKYFWLNCLQFVLLCDISLIYKSSGGIFYENYNCFRLKPAGNCIAWCIADIWNKFYKDNVL